MLELYFWFKFVQSNFHGSTREFSLTQYLSIVSPLFRMALAQSETQISRLGFKLGLLSPFFFNDNPFMRHKTGYTSKFPTVLRKSIG